MLAKRDYLAGVSCIALALVAAPASAQSQPTTTTATVPAATGATAMETISNKPLRPVYRNVRAFYRNVRAFWGDVNPFYRNVRAFWGDVDPFYRNVRAFWGNVDPALLANGAGAPVYAGVGPFWEGLGTQWDGIATTWQTAGAYNQQNAGDYTRIAGQLNTLVSTSESFWGGAVQKRTGSSFKVAFSDPFLARYGISLNDPASLAKLDPAMQSQFFIEWYDGLMQYSGTDAADHWMKAVNWTPKLTQVQGSGVRAVIGLVDQFSASDADTKGKLIYAGGTKFEPASVDGAIHGAGVLSLINANHDGRGVMGIAPQARVAAYNPFDANGFADWNGVIAGIIEVGTEREINREKMRAGVINLSLGAPNTTLAADWRTVFKTGDVDKLKDKVIYVIAAGNDGFTQTANINMKDAFDSTFIVVGSVGPNGIISDFSNRPGTACLTDNDTCKMSTSLKESGLLMNRFITAPGELILVSDGKGGVTRQSGTSLSAPLVAGAIALIHDRWPWMKDKPRDVARMILGSARDAGAPGVDPVYGVGILDVEAAQAPLNFAEMKFYLKTTTGSKAGEVKAADLVDVGIQSTWTTRDMYFVGFEKVIDAERDFLIPLSSSLYGTTQQGNYFQDFVYDRLASWLNGGSTTSTTGLPGFTDQKTAVALGDGEDWSLHMRGRVIQSYTAQGESRDHLNSTVELRGPEGRYGLSFGQGDGAVALGGSNLTGLSSDFDPYAGGVNPLLGFASGGGHAGMNMLLAEPLRVSIGYTEQTRSRGTDLHDASWQDRVIHGNQERYKAEAMNLRLDYSAAPWLLLNAAATSLAEPNAFLGVRSTVDGLLGEGTRTNGATFGFDADAGSGIAFFGSASLTSSNSVSDSALRIRDAQGTAFQAGVSKLGLLGNSDALRMSVAKPLGTDRGTVELTQMQVIDRQTGEKGWVTESFDVSRPINRLVVEGLYGAPVMEGQGQLSLFGRGELQDTAEEMPRLMLGGQFQLAF